MLRSDQEPRVFLSAERMVILISCSLLYFCDFNLGAARWARRRLHCWSAGLSQLTYPKLFWSDAESEIDSSHCDLCLGAAASHGDKISRAAGRQGTLHLGFLCASKLSLLMHLNFWQILTQPLTLPTLAIQGTTWENSSDFLCLQHWFGF